MADINYDITEEKKSWKGFKVWYVKPKPCKVDVNNGIPSFLLYDGTSYRYATQPIETLEIMKDFCMPENYYIFS